MIIIWSIEKLVIDILSDFETFECMDLLIIEVIECVTHLTISEYQFFFFLFNP